MTTRIFAVVLLTAFIGKDAFAWDPKSECPKLPKDSVKSQMLAGRLFAEAEAKYREILPIEALKGFLCSFQIIQHENTLFNIAQIAKLSANREEALVLLRDFVANASGSTKVEPIQELIAEIEDQVEGEASNAASGLHTAPDAKTKAARDETPEARKIKPETPSPPSEPSTDKARKSNPLKISGWAVFGVGAAGAVTGGVLQGLAGSAQKQAEGADSYPDFNDAQSRMSRLQTGAVVSFAVGGTLLAAGLVLVVLSNKHEPEKAAILVAPSPAGFSIQGRF